jgi:hypothetical protein
MEFQGGIMVKKSMSFKLDGKSSFSVDDDYSWKNGKLDFVQIRTSETSAINVTANLSGSNWVLNELYASAGTRLKVVVKDAPNNSTRQIETMALHGKAGNDVTLTGTHVDQYDGSDGVDKLTIGAGGIDMVNLREGNNYLKGGAGTFGVIIAGSGNDRIVAGKGAISNIDLNAGNDTVTTGAGKITSIAVGDGDDTVNINGKGNVDIIHLGSGENVLNKTGGGTCQAIFSYKDDDIINITGGGIIGTINVGMGNNVIRTGVGPVATIVAFEGNQTLTIGSGGAGIIRLADGDSKITANGHVTVLGAGFGDKNYVFNDIVRDISLGGGKNTLVFNGDIVDSINISEGTNRLTFHGTNVGQIATGAGVDVIYAGSGSIGSAQLSSGSDTVFFYGLKDSSGVSMFNGGGGTDSKTGKFFTDTINFSNFGSGGVTVSLAVLTAQDTGDGSVRLVGFEKIVGSDFNDNLSGSGLDEFFAGGRGKDVLTGGRGADTFIFSTGDSKDTISDFSAADGDKIDLSHLTAYTSYRDLSSHITESGGDVVIDLGGSDEITLSGVSKGDITAAQFAF